MAFRWWIRYSLEKNLEQTVEEDLIGRFELLAIQPQLLEVFIESGSSFEVFQAFAKKICFIFLHWIPKLACY